MTVDIASFDDFEHSEQIEDDVSGLIKIYLEGIDDRRLFREYWFYNYLDRFDFDIPSRDAGGSMAVYSEVNATLASGKAVAFGIVDRDVLFRNMNWDLLFEEDDNHFQIQQPFGSNIYVTLLWEIEAYLLDPELLHDWIKNSCRDAPNLPHSPDSLLDSCVDHCHCVLRIAEIASLAHMLRIKLCGNSNSDLFAHDRAQNDIPKIIQNKLAEFRSNVNWVEEEHGLVYRKISEFVNKTMESASSESSADRLRRLLRFVDTKWLLTRLTKAFGMKDNAKWVLADKMKDKNRRPPELKELLDRLAPS